MKGSQNIFRHLRGFPLSVSLLDSSTTIRHILSRKRRTPSTPLVAHGLSLSNGPRKQMYIRVASAPYCSRTSSGLTTFCRRFDILNCQAQESCLDGQAFEGSSWLTIPASKSTFARNENTRGAQRCARVHQHTNQRASSNPAPTY